jgi:hypothetical protein
MPIFTPFGFRKYNPIFVEPTTPYVTDGLIYYVDAGDTDSYPGSGTTWTDLSGQGRTTTLINGPTFDSGDGGSINFDGSNDFAGVQSFNPNITTKTMLGWVRLKNISQQGGGLIGSGFTSYNANTFDAIVYNETNQGWGFGSDGFARTFWSGVKETSTDDWAMITAVYQSGTNGYKMYRQDTLIAQGTKSVLTINNANSGYWLGKRHAATTGPLNAYIAVGMIYNKALSSTEVTQNYNHFKGRFGL